MKIEFYRNGTLIRKLTSTNYINKVLKEAISYAIIETEEDKEEIVEATVIVRGSKYTRIITISGDNNG